MSDVIAEEIEQLIKDNPKLKDYGHDYLFSAMCLKYFYFEGHFSIKDFKGVFVDGKNDGGIDLITVDDSEERPRLVFVQGKYISGLPNKQDVVDVFTKMHQTINDFKNNKYATYNPRLKRIYKEQTDLIQDQNPDIPQLVLFIDVDLDEEKRDWVKNRLKDVIDDCEITIFDSHQIEEQIELTNSPSSHVNEDKIDYAPEDGKLKYGVDGILVNVYANSIRGLYVKHKDKGLFAQNFRYFVRNKKIDDSVNVTLEKKRSDFWYLNNGIIIGCKDFSFDGNKIKLYDFSIINGCQTTTLIGEYSGKHEGEDFKVHCKIVKSTEHNENFVGEIAEASNSQKPILDRDLKSNYPEQKKLKQSLEKSNPPIYLEVKRGQPKPSKKGKEDWQFVKNDVLGQMMLSFLFQQPGTARSNKQKIFSDNDTYTKLFKRNHDAGMITDLLKLDALYGKYKDKKLSDDSAIDEAILVNSDKVVLALIGFIVKVKRGLVDPRKIKHADQWEPALCKDDIQGGFLVEVENNQKIIDGLFTYLNHGLFNVYKANEQDEKSVSNFFKTDAKYREKILRHFVNTIYLNEFELDSFNEKFLGILK